jgi:predicted nucleotidyltransferase
MIIGAQLESNRGEIWAFGSRVRVGAAKKFSDLDLTFVGSKVLSSLEIEKLKEQFSSSDLPFKIDLCNLIDLPEAIQKSITKEHVVLWS